MDEQGQLIDGDQVLALCGSDLKSRGELSGDTIVATVMSNLGFHIFARQAGIDLVCTDVGDRNVLEEMEKGGFVLGGEQSGHTIFRRYATTGDGELTALQLLSVVHRSGTQRVSALVGMCERYPQVLLNVPVDSKEKKEQVMADPALKKAVARVEKELDGDGRVLVRPSGTEALIRVMVEAKKEATAQAQAEKLANIIKNMG